MDKDPYDKPEDKSETFGRALVLLIGVAALLFIVWAVFFSGEMPISR